MVIVASGISHGMGAMVIMAVIHFEPAGMASTRAGERYDPSQNGAKQRQEDDRLNHTLFNPSSD
jgi:hypothetical protein